jgi:hypothetical protein
LSEVLTKEEVNLLLDSIVRLSAKIDALTKPNCSSSELTEYRTVKRLFMDLMEMPLSAYGELQCKLTEIELYEYNRREKIKVYFDKMTK